MIHGLGEALASNTALMHLDISNNQLDHVNMNLFGKCLAGNHTLIGLHVSGNQAHIDSKGFVIADEKGLQIQSQHKFCSIQHFEIVNEQVPPFPGHHWPSVDRSCWYCGCWSEHEFSWAPTSVHVDIKTSEKVYLNLSIDNWERHEMSKLEDGSYACYRVLPPGKTQYFISVLEPDNPTAIARKYMRQDRNNSRLLRRPGDAAVFGNLTRANYIEMPKSEDRCPCDATVPRPLGTYQTLRKWNLKKSVLASRAREAHCRDFTHSNVFYAKAFAADWRQCKVDRVVKSVDWCADLERVCLAHYPRIMCMYQHYCAQSIVLKRHAAKYVATEVSSIIWSAYVEFLNDCKLLEDNKCQMSDPENVFLAANLEVTAEAKEVDNPDRSLMRFEFLECLCRIGNNKHLVRGLCMFMSHQVIYHAII